MICFVTIFSVGFFVKACARVSVWYFVLWPTEADTSYLKIHPSYDYLQLRYSSVLSLFSWFFFLQIFPPHVLVCSVVQCVSPTSTESCSFDHAEFDMFTMILNLSRSCFESHEQPPSSLISQFQTSEWKKCSFHWSYHLRPSLFPSWHFSMWFFFTQIASFIAFEFDKTIGLFWFFFFLFLLYSSHVSIDWRASTEDLTLRMMSTVALVMLLTLLLKRWLVSSLLKHREMCLFGFLESFVSYLSNLFGVSWTEFWCLVSLNCAARFLFERDDRIALVTVWDRWDEDILTIVSHSLSRYIAVQPRYISEGYRQHVALNYRSTDIWSVINGDYRSMIR